MERHYKYISENSLKYVFLHDCCCSRIHFADNKLIFEMDWMEILAQHPLNPYPQAHQSGPGIIELVHPRIIECTLAESSITQNNPQSIPLGMVAELNFCDAEFRYYTETKNDKCYQAEMYLAFDERNSLYYGTFIHIAYEKSVVMWNELNDISWFEDYI